jgi:flagellar motor protein MotB
MKHVELLSTGVLLILLGSVAPAFAQERHEQEAQAPRQVEQSKPEKQAKPAKQQKAQQPQAKGEQKQQKVQQKQARAQQKQEKAQQPKSMSQQEGSSQRPQRTPQDEAKQRGEPALRLSARGQGRIPDDRFRSNFGSGHRFRIGSPRMVDGFSRFQYGGFWFGFVQPWPDGWYYTDDVYIDFIDGEYYMFDPYYPGVRIAICVVV